MPSRSAAMDSRGDGDGVFPLHNVIGGKLRFSFAVFIFLLRAVTAVYSVFFLLLTLLIIERAREGRVGERRVLNVV